MRFKCMQCGNCCRSAGALRLIPEDIDAISRYLGMNRQAFMEKYRVERICDALFFIEIDGCPFLTEDNRCAIQNAKPFFCRNYVPFIDQPPFAECRGIGHGREYTDTEVREIYNTMLSRLVVKEVIADGNDAVRNEHIFE